MMGFLVLGIGLGLGVAAYRGLPPLPDSALSLVLVIWVVSVAAAWFGAKHRSMNQWQAQWQEQAQAQLQEQLQQQGQHQQQVVQVVTADGLAGVALVEGSPASAALPRGLDDLSETVGRFRDVDEVEAVPGFNRPDHEPVVDEQVNRVHPDDLPSSVAVEPNRDNAIRPDHPRAHVVAPS